MVKLLLKYVQQSLVICREVMFFVSNVINETVDKRDFFELDHLAKGMKPFLFFFLLSRYYNQHGTFKFNKLPLATLL